jgi:1,4-dihydroxy-2-naphthoate octaprenyltransferase
MPVIFGSLLAVTIGKAKFNFLLFSASLLGMAILHTGANLLNDVYDYKKGVDQHVNPVSGGVVRGWITTREALIAGWLFLAMGSVIGLGIVSQVGFPILWIGLLGIAIGVLYTWGPLPIKFNALGDLAVFLNFGILGALGAWTVQTGKLSWVPALWAVPMSLLVVGILHANNWRDIKLDSQGGIRTLASMFGDIKSEGYFAFLLFGPFAVILILVFLSLVADLSPQMPLTFLVTFLAMPMAIKLMKTSRQRHNPGHIKDFLALDGATAQFHLVFGVLCVSALGLNALLNLFK